MCPVTCYRCTRLFTDADFGFKTFVVPEASACALLALGLAAVLGGGRRVKA